MKTYSKINTFTRAPSPAQICSYIVVSLQTCIFYIMIMPSIQSHTSKLILTILFSVSLGALLITTFICSYIDPSDSVMVEHKSNNKNKPKLNISQLLYCDYCHSYVTTAARHCRQCDRCVQNFDHHCMWINNCVGSKNYYVFIAMIVSTCTNLAIYLASVILLSVEKQWMAFLAFIITCWVVMVIVGILWILLFNLNLLHFYLICKGYTTYQFIMVRKQQQRQKQMEKIERQAKQREQKLRATVENSKKKILDSKTAIQKTNQNHLPSQQMIESNKKRQQFNKTPKKIMRKTTEGNGSEQQTNSRINFTRARSSSGKNKQQEGSYESNKQKRVSEIGNEQNDNNNVIFGEQNNEQSMHERSEVQSIKIGDIHNQKLDNNLENQNSYNNKQEQQKCDSSQGNSSIRISQFFTRNKSFNFLISNQPASKPHKKMQNISLHYQQPIPRIKQKQSLSNKINKSKSQKQRVFKNQGPYLPTKTKIQTTMNRKKGNQ